MNRLVQTIANQVNAHVAGAIARLTRPDGEFRAVFHGPPMEILRPIFDALTKDGGIEAKLANGDAVTVPVLLLVDRPSEQGPKIGESGICTDSHVINVRNATTTPRFLVLVEPGHLASLSVRNAAETFGLTEHANSGTASTSQWWRDPFVQWLVNSRLERAPLRTQRDRDDALSLIEKAVIAADKIDKSIASRHSAWKVLSRLWSISDPNVPFGSQLSLACGFPPVHDGSIDATAQEVVLAEIAELFADSGFRTVVEELKPSGDTNEQAALDELLSYLFDRCSVGHRFGHAPAYYYEPSGKHEVTAPPSWWKTLTVEVWQRLLDGEKPQPPGEALELGCLNPLLPPAKGLPVIVANEVQISARRSGEPLDVTISRKMTGADNQQGWNTKTGVVIRDKDIPEHRSPIRYTAEATDYRNGTLRVVSLAGWVPGVVVYSRTAIKTSLPKRTRRGTDGVDFDLSLSLSGQGRHYFDVHVRPGVLLGSFAYGSADNGSIDLERKSGVARIGETDVYGFEVEAIADCFYQFEATLPNDDTTRVFRIHITCDEAAPEQCSSEFERLIRLNRTRGVARASTDVSVNRQLRSADLQGWILSKEQAGHSFKPFVLGPDYASTWRSRDWSSAQLDETVFSNGRYLHDPRPRHEEMSPPEQFRRAREALFAKIRGDDENTLIEACTLGEWLSKDSAFAQLVEEYLDAYMSWFEASPDAAAWCDVGIVSSMEQDGTTLVQEPDAIILSPFHPVRLAWHCLAQRALFHAQRILACPAASILDPDSVPDALALPLRTAAGGVKHQIFFSVECSSDYWTILWNGSRLDRLPQASTRAPFDRQFGVLVGGVSSGFSASQVSRALEDIADILVAKPLLNIAVSSAAGHNNACNEGLLAWCRDRFMQDDEGPKRLLAMGPRFVQIIDERLSHARPEDAEVSNLAEDTANAVRWIEKRPDCAPRPDLTIIAQLETSNPGADQIGYGSPLGPGGLIRHRVRQQLSGGNGAFLTESRMAIPRGPSADALADKTAAAIVRIENTGNTRYGYTFAPSVNAIRAALQKSDYAAVSSSAVDPACFLGGWLDDMYLWDYELPSYSHRPGDSNGYYLLSRVKDLDRETLHGVLAKLPGCEEMNDEQLQGVILEVARRGIPTVRGLSRGDSGASGDLGLFVASRVLQDDFRVGDSPGSLLPVLKQVATTQELALIIPVDPFRGYIDDLARAIGQTSFQRPDLLVAGIFISDSKVECRLTPVEVKYRAKDSMPVVAAQDALEQAKAFSDLLNALSERAKDPELVAWKLAFQHLLAAMLGFGLRVYSQQRVAANQASGWATMHARLLNAVLGDELSLQVDQTGRLFILDSSPTSDVHDHDRDGFGETIVVSRSNASTVVQGNGHAVYASIKSRIGDWRLMPQRRTPEHTVIPSPTPSDSNPPSTDMTVRVPPIPVQHAASSPQQVQRPITPAQVVQPAPAAPLTQPSGVADGGTGVDILVGSTIDGFQREDRRLNLSDTRLNQLNIGVVGDLGTGKTQLLKSLVYQIASSQAQNRGIRPRFLIFDYKKDYTSDDFVKAVGARIAEPRHLPINLFDISGASESITPWLDRFSFFVDILSKIYSGIGGVQRQFLRQAVRQAYDTAERNGRQPTIYDVHANYAGLIDKPDSPFGILQDLVDRELFSPDPSAAQSVTQFLDGVVVVPLHKLGQDDRTKNMLVAIMLNVFYEQMLRISKRPFLGQAPQLRAIDSFLLVDEADNIMRYEFDVLRKVLLQGREFGVGVILASQYLRHFKTGATDYREPLLSWFIHKVPNIVPQELGALGLAGDVAHLTERIKTLEMHECLFKTHNVHGEFVKGMPFYKLIRGS